MAGFSYEDPIKQQQDQDEQFGLGLQPGTGTMPTAPQAPSAPSDGISFAGASNTFNEKGQTLEGPASPGVPPGSQGTDAQVFDQSRNLADLVRQVNNTTDPRQKSVLQDQAARGLFTTLKSQGHDVKWQGDQLIVDGRAYVLGDGGNTGINGGPDAAATRAGAGVQPVGHDGVTSGGLSRDAYRDLWMSSGARTIDDVKQFIAQHGGQLLSDNGTVLTPFGEQLDMLIGARTGNGAPGWTATGADASALASLGATGGDFDLGSLSSLLGLTDVGLGSRLGPPSALPAAPAFSPTAPAYTPGDTPEDLSGFDLDQMMQVFGADSPIDLSGGANGRAVDDLLARFLQNPYSISDLDIDKMKAKSKDELADMARSDDEALRHFGIDTGIADSTWLASARADRRGQRDNALVLSNRQIEGEAAATRKEDERQAIGIGQSAKQSTIDNLFKSRAEQQTAKQLATDTTLRAASLNNDRAALRESIKQKATELGQSADQIQLQYTLGLMDDSTKRYGIDVDRDIELLKNATNVRLAAEELAFKYASLVQGDAQFGADYGLRLKQFEADENDRNWRRQLDVLGLGE